MKVEVYVVRDGLCGRKATLNSNLFKAEFFSERHWRDPRSVSGGLSEGIRDPRKSGEEGVITNTTLSPPE